MIFLILLNLFLFNIKFKKFFKSGFYIDYILKKKIEITIKNISINFLFFNFNYLINITFKFFFNNFIFYQFFFKTYKFFLIIFISIISFIYILSLFYIL